MFRLECRDAQEAQVVAAAVVYILINVSSNVLDVEWNTRGNIVEVSAKRAGGEEVDFGLDEGMTSDHFVDYLESE